MAEDIPAQDIRRCHSELQLRFEHRKSTAFDACVLQSLMITPDRLSDRMSESMPDRKPICRIECQKVCQKECQNICPINARRYVR